MIFRLQSHLSGIDTVLPEKLFGTSLLGDCAVGQDDNLICAGNCAHTAVNQDEYKQRYESLVRRFEKAKFRLQEIDGTIIDREKRRLQIELFINELQKQDCLITEFDEKLWLTLIDYITVYSTDDMRFTFKNGEEVKA